MSSDPVSRHPEVTEYPEFDVPPGSREPGHPPTATNGNGSRPWSEEHARWEQRSRIVLTPVAAPSALGLFAFAVSTLMVATNLAGWWGDAVTGPVIVAPFAFFFGGLVQLLAGMWAFRARDVVATAMHGAWGAFWLGWGLLVLLITVGALPPGVLESPAFGMWFVGLAVITAFGTAGAAFANWSLTVTLGFLTLGAALLAIGLLSGATIMVTIGAYALIASAVSAFWTGGALLLGGAAGGRVVIPTGAREPGADVPGTRLAEPVQYARGMPGAKIGQ